MTASSPQVFVWTVAGSPNAPSVAVDVEPEAMETETESNGPTVANLKLARPDRRGAG